MITSKIIERNARIPGDVATCNGVSFEVSNLPALSGSEKQVSWAEKIRADTLHNIHQELTDRVQTTIKQGGCANGSFGSYELFDDLNAKLASKAALIDKQLSIVTKASWWIDNREAITRSFAGKAALVALQKAAKEIA